MSDDYETLVLMIKNLKFYNVPDDEIKGIIDKLQDVILDVEDRML